MTPRRSIRRRTARSAARTLLVALVAGFIVGPVTAETTDGEPLETPQTPAHSLLGLELGMTSDEVHGVLGEVASLEGGRSGVRGEKQFWKLDDTAYQWIAVRFGPDQRVKWVTAFARSDTQAVRYTDIADVEIALQRGQYYFSWNIPPMEGRAGYSVIARGSDPVYLSSVSLYR